MTSSSSSAAAARALTYNGLRATVDGAAGAREARVQVNQRALIDKILARYASAGAVYRELLQNSNDAEADTAEICFDTTAAAAGRRPTVTQVLYRNNGIPFRPQDWDRLKNIAEGNPDPEKIGAFGVGAYTMFSICEEPLVVSGRQALCFVWKGDALWTRTADAPASEADSRWTSFVLPSRDPYPLPDMEEFGEFLCASLTFTKNLRLIRVLVDDQERLCIIKTLVQEPRAIATPSQTSGTASMVSSWLLGRGDASISTTTGIFTLTPKSIKEFVYRITVTHTPDSGDISTSFLDARYVSAAAATNIKTEMARRMERVTKKLPPQSLAVQLFLNAQSTTSVHSSGSQRSSTMNIAERIVQTFCPQPGKGRIFIGFRTSQTTGLGAHVAAPFVPTVEREAMDLQDASLRSFNMELLEFSGMLLRYTLEDTMQCVIDAAWQQSKAQRLALQAKLEREHAEKGTKKTFTDTQQPVDASRDKIDGAHTDGSDVDDTGMVSSSSGVFGFAKFMAKGIKKKIVSVVSTVEEFMDDSAEYLHPVDLMPLSEEEVQAVVLMRSFCPEQSTPDALVGMCMAEGFSKCVSGMPPVLTRSGVVKGDIARLPNNGIETFVEDAVVRRIVFSNAEEYHTVVASVRKLALDDLLHALYSNILEVDKLVLFFRWWTKYSRADPRGAQKYGLLIKDAVKFYCDGKTDGKVERPVVELKNVLFYVEKGSAVSQKGIPLPETVIDPALGNWIGMSVLTDSTFRDWFSPLPMEVWVSFIAQMPFMNDGTRENEQLRLNILSIFSREFLTRSSAEKLVFGSFLASLLSDKRCIPYDSSSSEGSNVAVPSEVYAFSAKLEAFESLGPFFKVSEKVQAAGISEEFLLAIGVRQSVPIDFLFASLDSLQWSDNPKPLVEYLRCCPLTQKDIGKLRQTRYLPAEAQGGQTFAPAELYLPSSELRLFPFVRMLQWPEKDLPENSENGAFLVKLGMKTLPPLTAVLTHASTKVDDDETRIKVLDFIADRLGPHGFYQSEYSRMDFSIKSKYRCLPCVTMKAFGVEKDFISELHSPVTCYAIPSCIDMGFPVIDPSLGDRGKLYASLFQCPSEPDANVVLEQYLVLVTLAQSLQREARSEIEKQKSVSSKINEQVAKWYTYLSHRGSDFSKTSLDALRTRAVIPCLENDIINWYRVDQVFFRKDDGEGDVITEELFHLVNFSPFLATLGVKQEASTADLFQLLLARPQHVLDTLGSEAKYRLLLRRIAANPPFARVTASIRNSPFLLGYVSKPADDSKSAADSMSYKLLKADDIFIIDNTFFARMFPVARAPPETDLEDFYFQLGSQYISSAVDRRFEVVGRPQKDTEITKALKLRILARGPLLVSPNITSRPLVSQPETILTEKHLEVFEATNLMAVYSLNGIVRRNRTTCFSRPSSSLGTQGNTIFVVKDFDWFDVGYAIGDLILKRCQLEDAFFISSLLEAPIDQLQARGFPVDRILKQDFPKPAIAPESAPDAAAVADPASNNHTAVPAPTIASIPKSVNKSTNSTKEHSGQMEAASAAIEPDGSPNGLNAVLRGVFPDADMDYIRDRLGSNPTMEQVHRLADEMSSANYPKNSNFSKGETDSMSSTMVRNETEEAASVGAKKSALRKKLGRAFNGLRPSSIGGMAPTQLGSGGLLNKPQESVSGTSGEAAGRGQHLQEHKESQNPVPVIEDVQSHKSLGCMLENAVRSSSQVNKSGIHSQHRHLTSIPEGLDRGETCEMIPGHSLKPFQGPRGTGMTSNGIRIFSAREIPQSETFLLQNDAIIESFAVVLERLCEVYGLSRTSIAIFHDPNGRTIAFNAGKAIHCNIRFFHALFYSSKLAQSTECYSYWFVTLAHELAHHMVSAHNKEHGFYTESYVSIYLPKLASLLASIQ